MFKRVTLLFALLFTNIAMAQSVETSVTAPSVISTDNPVLIETIATGTATTTEETASTTDGLPSAEVTSTIGTTSSSTVAESESGAFGTSTGTTSSEVSSTTVEEEHANVPDNQDNSGFFNLVYAGFEEFVRITLGWE